MAKRETPADSAMYRRARVAMRLNIAAAQTRCWHCGAMLEAGTPTARYLYRGDRPNVAIVEDWYRCGCGAYQNVRGTTEISVRFARPE
jgi:hypothetical protein